jgi:peptidoglycan/xylan/chitin deacetylase (PgdA/CDA1 family)
MTGRQRISYAGKRALTYTLYYTGLLRLWLTIALRRKAVVLMYHRVLTAEERARSGSHPALIVDRDTFARQMAALRRFFVVLSVEQLAAHLASGSPLPDGACVITFDDGWRDNFTNVLPILRQHGLPALVFLPVNFIGGARVFWQEAMVHLLTRAVRETRADAAAAARLTPRLEPFGLSFLLSAADEDPRGAIFRAVDGLKRTEPARVSALIADLAGDLGVALDDLAAVDGFMTWDQVHEMARHDIAFGGHGAEHRLLTYVSADEARSEIGESRAMMATRFADTVPTFSYPNGYFTSAIADTVRASGYRLAFTTDRGFVRTGDNPFALGRLNVHEGMTDTTPMFLARIVGLL